MKTAKKKHLEERGWKVGGTAEFLSLSLEEVAYIDLKLAFKKFGYNGLAYTRGRRPN